MVLFALRDEHEWFSFFIESEKERFRRHCLFSARRREAKVSFHEGEEKDPFHVIETRRDVFCLLTTSLAISACHSKSMQHVGLTFNVRMRDVTRLPPGCFFNELRWRSRMRRDGCPRRLTKK